MLKIYSSPTIINSFPLLHLLKLKKQNKQTNKWNLDLLLLQETWQLSLNWEMVTHWIFFSPGRIQIKNTDNLIKQLPARKR